MKKLFLACGVPLLGGCAAVIPALHSGAAAVAAHAAAAPLATAAGAAGVGLGIGVIASDDIKRLARDAQETQFGTQTAGTLGAFLQDSQSEVQSMVRSAMQTQREVLVVAGLRVHGAIVRARAAYQDKLKLKFERLGEPENKFRTELEAVITELKSETESTQKAAGERAQLIAANLRPPADAPQLASFGPIFLFPFLPTQSVTLRGRFPNSYDRSGVPEIVLDGKPYKAFDYQADSLRFSIPTAAFEAAEPQAIVWKTTELVVPWSTPVWNIAASLQSEKFNVVIGVLPNSFGSMNIQHMRAKPRQEESPRFSDDFLFDATDHDVEENRCLTLTPQELTDGWRIRRGSGAFVLNTRFEGTQHADWKDLELQSESDRSVCWRARTVRGGTAAAESGKIMWSISARIWREVMDTDRASENVDLAWGSKHYFKYAAGTWKLRYSRIGGSARELESPDSSNPLIKVSSDVTGVTVSIYPF